MPHDSPFKVGDRVITRTRDPLYGVVRSIGHHNDVGVEFIGNRGIWAIPPGDLLRNEPGDRETDPVHLLDKAARVESNQAELHELRFRAESAEAKLANAASIPDKLFTAGELRSAGHAVVAAILGHGDATVHACIDQARDEHAAFVEAKVASRTAELQAANARLREELVEWWETEIYSAGYHETSGEFKGWWDSQADSGVVDAGEKLVEAGLWEQHPGGVGRRQWFRKVAAALAATPAAPDTRYAELREVLDFAKGQSDNIRHPYTCDNRSGHPVRHGDKGVLYPAIQPDGTPILVCPDCDYTQAFPAAALNAEDAEAKEQA